MYLKRFLGIGSLVWLGVTSAYGQELCGPLGQEVCIAGNANFILNCDNFQAGTALLLKMPGVENSSSSEASGEADVPYWFSLDHGVAGDSTGGTWSGPTPILTDERGARAVVFRLESGTLNGTVQFVVNNVTVCQYVGDGPGLVTLEWQLWGVAKQGYAGAAGKVQLRADEFDPCTAYQGYAPVTDDHDQFYVVNPHDEEMSFTYGTQSHQLAPHEQRLLSPQSGVNIISANMAPALLIRRDDSDLDMVSFPSKASDDWLVPHLAENLEQWQNALVFAAGTQTYLQMEYGSGSQSGKLYDAGVYRITPADPDGEHPPLWLKVNANQDINTYFHFERTDQSGGAMVSAQRYQDGQVGATRLVLPHVAASTELFWTGYALTNPNGNDAQVTMIGYGEGQSETERESFVLPAGGKEIGLIGQARLSSGQLPSWVVIESDLPLIGMELFGDARQNSFLSGFLLAETAETLCFPHFYSSSDDWCGIALLNSSDSEVSGTLRYYSESGAVVSTKTLTLVSGEKWLDLPPQSASHGLWQGGSLSGICVQGDEAGTKAGAYLAQSMD